MIRWPKRSHISSSRHDTGRGCGRLVPLGLIDVTGNDVLLHCDLAAFEGLEMAEEIQFMPESVGYATV